MTVLDIIYIRYYDTTGNVMTIGGIQTYITRLSHLAITMGFHVRIFQYSDIPFSKQHEYNTEIIGIPLSKKKQTADNLYKEVEKSRKNNNSYISIFATDTLIPTCKVSHSIAIQHGVFWDMEAHKRRSFLRSFASKTIEAYRTVSRLRNVEDVVCVDNNFICWHRTQLHERDVNLIPIMNFTEIGPKDMPQRSNDYVSIVFARRFFDYRGTRIFAAAIKRLFKENYKIKVTFAGEGPDEEWLKEQFAHFKNIVFTHYESSKSIEFHSQFDIAAIPTTGSEGTSLSLLEAMSAHCAILCTNVGGMTNIVIDGYNGIISSPTADSIYDGLKYLVSHPEKRKKLAQRGYETVSEGFNLRKWEEKWAQVLTSKMREFSLHNTSYKHQQEAK